jgi:hypothetical protein
MLKKLGKSDYTNLEVYRSITLLNIIEKILKTVISNRIKYIANTYNLLSNTQYSVYTSWATETVF